MSNRDLPMMPWFPQDFAGATSAYTFVERALYRSLLDAQWIVGALPADEARLARVAGMASPEEFELFQAAWPTVSRKFEPVGEGEIVNKRLEEHRLKAIRLHEQRSSAGQASAATRLQRANQRSFNGRSNARSTSDATPLEHLSPSPSPSKDKSKNKTPSLRSGAPVSKSSLAAVSTVFEHWKHVHNHPRAALTKARESLIRKALTDYSDALLCQAISGYANSPHHMGDNDRGTVYDSIELMLRDAKHIDQGLKFYSDPPRRDHSSLTRRNVDATKDWVPPEMRRDAED
jgi:uncharacterized protein YdaU (DUF1376 family)